MTTMNYFGEWSDSLGQPHGRGFQFGYDDHTDSYTTRIGYFTNGRPSDGKVLKLARQWDCYTGDLDEIIFHNGEEKFRDGKTTFKGR